MERTRVLALLLCAAGVMLLLAGVMALPVGAAGQAAPPLQPSPRPPWNTTMTPTPSPVLTPTPTSAPPPTATPTPTPTPVPVLLPISGGRPAAGWLLGLGIVLLAGGLALGARGWGAARVPGRGE